MWELTRLIMSTPDPADVRDFARRLEIIVLRASLPPHELVQSAYLAVRDRAVRYRHGMGPGARWPSLQQVRRTLRRAGLRLRRRGRGGP